MSNDSRSPPCPADMRPTPYHYALLEYLQTEESDLWQWFSSHKVLNEHAEAVRLELLKSTYRIEPETARELYASAEHVSEQLEHEVPVVLYQAQNPLGLNASLAWLPGEGHVVLHGPVRETLSENEFQALLGHELAHHLLFSVDDGAFLIVEQILAAMLGDRAATAAHQRTWQCFKLYTELFCDRLAYLATGDMAASVRALIKMETGLKEVSAESYLNQAAEVLAGGKAKSDGTTHPEMFIRARALHLWSEESEDVYDTLSQWIEGPVELKSLDLLRQKSVTELTRGLLARFLAPGWMQTESVLRHTKHFFDDFSLADSPPVDPDELRRILTAGDDQLTRYFCYVILDFVTSDPELEEAPLAAAVILTRELRIEARFTGIVVKELRLRKRQLEAVARDAERIVAQAEKQLIE